MEESIYNLASAEGQSREIELTVERDDGYFLAMAVKNDNGDEITNVVLADDLVKLDDAEQAFTKVFAEARERLTKG